MYLSVQRLVIGWALVFLAGVLFGRLVSYHVYREETVMVIGSSGAEGCEGRVGLGTVFFGKVRGNSDGAYVVACGDRVRLSEQVQIVCKCP